MRIILLGAPGSGKGTQAQFITKKYGIPQISTGDMLRSNLEIDNRFDKQEIKMINSGKLVTDQLVINLVKERITYKDCQKGFLLDGFPRTIQQAKSIKNNNINIDYILEFCVPYKIIMDRIMGRRMHMSSGRIYHVKFNPEKISGKDDITGEALVIRKDDNRNAILQRLIEYKNVTNPVVNYYINESKKHKMQYHKIDGTQKIIEINTKIETILN
ncbi:Adenylate kinase [Candidatus Ecksteinia adelgidicola]|nr:Adenylate kinase [Candidatus Ecksteinia adelgidicola]